MCLSPYLKQLEDKILLVQLYQLPSRLRCVVKAILFLENLNIPLGLVEFRRHPIVFPDDLCNA